MSLAPFSRVPHIDQDVDRTVVESMFQLLNRNLFDGCQRKPCVVPFEHTAVEVADNLLNTHASETCTCFAHSFFIFRDEYDGFIERNQRSSP